MRRVLIAALASVLAIPLLVGPVAGAVPPPGATSSAPAPATIGLGLFDWGRNAYGQELGSGLDFHNSTDPAGEFTAEPVPVDTTGILRGLTITQLSHHCVLANGRVACWGVLDATGHPTGAVPAWLPSVPELAFSRISIAPESSDGCGLSAGTLYCWGDNSVGQLGIGTRSAGSPTPVRVGGALAGKPIDAVSVSGSFTCALAANQVFCWGADDHGQLGNGHPTDPDPVPTQALPQPVVIPAAMAGLTLSDLTSTTADACVLAGGKPFCWGDDTSGLVGAGGRAAAVPVPIDLSAVGSAPITQLTMGWDSACLVAGAAVFCWGDNTQGRLVVGGSAAELTAPVPLIWGDFRQLPLVAVGLGHREACGLDEVHRVWCWGSAAFGSVGTKRVNPDGAYYPAPVYADNALSGKTVVALAIADDSPRVLTAESVETVTAAGGEQLITPTRILDTRVSGRPLPSLKGVYLQIAGTHGIPAGVAGVELTVTVTNPRQPGSLEVRKAGVNSDDTTAAVDFATGQTVADQSVVALGSSGGVTLINHSHGTTDVIIDVTAYFLGGDATVPGGFVPGQAVRLFDIRRTGGAVGAGRSIVVPLRPFSSTTPPTAFPSSFYAYPGTAFLTIQVIAGASPGYLKVAGEVGFPAVAVANFSSGAIVAATLRTTEDERNDITITNVSGAPIQIVVDSHGGTSGGLPLAAGAFAAVPVDRVLDTRLTATPLAAFGSTGVRLDENQFVPPILRAGAVVRLTTVAGPTAHGYSTMYGGPARPTSSTLDFPADGVVGNQVDLPLSATIFNGSGGRTDEVVDLLGYLVR